MSDLLKGSFSDFSPGVDIKRSTFTDNSYSHKTTVTAGDLVPLYFSEVLAGDTFSIDTSLFCRMSTPIYPVMDNAYIDIFYFYVPNRLVWSNYKEFFGENTSAPWVSNSEYTIPQMLFGVPHALDTKNYATGALPGTVMNYFGIPCSLYPDITYPTGSETEADLDFSVSDLPNRAYRLIWNEFFRSTALQYPVPVYTDDSSRYYTVDYDDWSIDYGGKPLKVNRLFDFFSACLPAPQFGDAVNMSLLNTTFPVIAQSPGNTVNVLGSDVLHWASRSLDGTGSWSTSVGNNFTINSNYAGVTYGDDPTSSPQSGVQLTPQNLHAIVNDFSIGTINQLRQAFQVQKFLELEARGGQRYRELLYNFFGVSVPDMRVQVPEYLGGDRIPVNMDQVLQTSSTDVTSPQGNTAGYSLTTSNDSSFTKSFVEPGMIIGLGCVRVSHSYPQAVYPYWFKKRKFDFYFPQFASLGEQPLLKKHFFPTGIPAVDNKVFGYLPAWSDYRYRFNQVSGAYSPLVYADSDSDVIYEQQSSLAQAWTYSDFYEMHYDDFRKEDGDLDYLTPPTLSGEWLAEDSVNIGQTLAVQNEPQFFVDMYFKVKTTRPMPVTSIPGLVDHH